MILPPSAKAAQSLVGTMVDFLKNRHAPPNESLEASALGILEMEVMEVMWTYGKGNVRDVAEKLKRPLAYTTVMTTLDRLFKKNLLDRHKSGRAFVYSPRFSYEEWEQKRAQGLVAGFLAGSEPSRELLISCLLDAVGQHDTELLDELEKKVRARRKELLRRGQP